MSTFQFDEAAEGLDPRIQFTSLRVVDDAGGQHLEAVVPLGQVIAAFPSGEGPLADAAIAPVANIRPEHTLVSRKRDGSTVLREGTMEIKPGKQRAKTDRWARQLINETLPEDQRDPEVRGSAVLGNLSIRLDPKHIHDGKAMLLDRDGNELEIDDLKYVQEVDLVMLPGAQFDTGVDSLSRLKAAYKAAQASPDSVNNRRTSVRVWIANDDQAATVAHAFNQEGDPVNATAAKYRHQEGPAQMVARALVDTSTHLGAKNIEIFSNTVSKNSPKLTSFNTVSLAVEKGWTHTPFDPRDAELAVQVDWLVMAWDELVTVRPEFGYVPLRTRQEYRQQSLAGSAVSVHGIISVFSAIYPGTDLSVLAKLNGAVQLTDTDGNPVLDGGGEPRVVDFFSYDNPIWVTEGVLAPGKNGLGLRMSFQTRKAMAAVIRQQLGL